MSGIELNATGDATVHDHGPCPPEMYNPAGQAVLLGHDSRWSVGTSNGVCLRCSSS